MASTSCFQNPFSPITPFFSFTHFQKKKRNLHSSTLFAATEDNKSRVLLPSYRRQQIQGSVTQFQCALLWCNKRRVNLVVNSSMATRTVSDDRMLVFVPPHPLIKHWVSVLRNEQTPCPIFKNAMAELGRLLIYEASRDWLPTITGEIQSPMGVASIEFIDPREPVTIVPILRAGLVLAEHVSSILPAIKTYHVGVCRDDKTLQPMVYLNKLPDNFPEGSRVLVTDPMLATGGTIVAVIDLLKDRGVGNNQIKVVSAVAAPPALQKLSERFPGLHVYAGIIDPTVNDKGFIIPGLGDAGDRSFST